MMATRSKHIFILFHCERSEKTAIEVNALTTDNSLNILSSFPAASLAEMLRFLNDTHP